MVHPVKELGVATINVRLKEGVLTQILLKVESETPLPPKPVKKIEEKPVEENPSNEQ
jgi:hypothetical protein